MKATAETRVAFLSVIIGDGSINKEGSATIKHCASQFDYLQWKRQYLLSKGVSCGEIRAMNSNGFPGYTMYINTTSYGKLYRRVLYRRGYKNVYQRKLLNRLSAEHIAIWYMDDGGLSQKKKDGVVTANDLILNTHTTKENNQVLIDYFKEMWGVSFTQVKNRGHYRIRCGTKEARKFLEIVREYVSQVPSMSHKLNIKSNN